MSQPRRGGQDLLRAPPRRMRLRIVAPQVIRHARHVFIAAQHHRGAAPGALEPLPRRQRVRAAGLDPLEREGRDRLRARFVRLALAFFRG
jgi:hypothetical protein